MNNTNICPIIYSNPGKVHNEINNSLEYYKKESTNHILKYLPIALVKSRKSGNKKIKKIISYILTNEDLFNNLMTSIMLADFTYDKNKSSLKYWRSKNCLWTLNRTIYKNKNKTYSLQEKFTEITPLDEVINKESFLLRAEKIENLSQREKQIINYYYNDNLNETEIAGKIDCSQQRVSQIISSIKKKINYE